jgi:hypothetical protein
VNGGGGDGEGQTPVGLKTVATDAVELHPSHSEEYNKEWVLFGVGQGAVPLSPL